VTDPEPSNEKVDLVDIRKRHKHLHDDFWCGVPGHPIEGNRCDALRLADELERSRKEIERLREALERRDKLDDDVSRALAALSIGANRGRDE